MRPFSLGLVFAVSLLLAAGGAHAFEKGGCGGGACTDCHSLTKEEAGKILAGTVDKVLSVELSPVGGLWVVGIEKDGNKWPVYIDFSKKFLINGQVIRYLHSTPDTLAEAELLANDMNAGMSKAAYFVEVEE